tara:strand:+ start:1930 stop:3333 length:1404 start_codon:yes stop_codon:yes gene_type:complete
MSDEEYYNYVTSSGFIPDDEINLETLRPPELIHYEEKTIPENTRFRNNLFAWLKQTRILAVNRKMFDPYQSHSYRQEELGSRNPLIHPTMRFPSYYRLFPGFPAYNSNPGGNGQQQNQQDLDTMNEAMLPQFLIRNPDQFIGQSLYQMLSSITAYNSYKRIINDAIRDIPYTERELREQAEYSRISDREPEFIARNQSNPNRHAGILEEWNIDDILDLLSYYLNDSGSGKNDTYRKLVVSSEYLWTGSVTTRQIDPQYLQVDESLFEDLTGYDFSEHLEENYDNRDDDQQDYGEWLDMQREEFDWSDAIGEYPVTAVYTGLVRVLWEYYGPNAERSAERRSISGTPHAIQNPKTQTRRMGVSQLRYGLLYHNPMTMTYNNTDNVRPSLPEDNDRYNDMLHTTEYTPNSVMWTNYYLARDPNTYLIIEDYPDELITELSSTRGFTFSIPVNFLNFLRYPPSTLKKTIF